MPRMICPNCEEEIESVDTSACCTEYGRGDLMVNPQGRVEISDWDHVEYGDSDDETRRCPECGDEIDLGDIIVRYGDDDEGENEATERAPEPRENAFVPANLNDPLDRFAFCEKCKELKQKEDLNGGKCEACRD